MYNVYVLFDAYDLLNAYVQVEAIVYVTLMIAFYSHSSTLEGVRASVEQRRWSHHVGVLLWVRDADVCQLDVQVLHKGKGNRTTTLVKDHINEAITNEKNNVH